MRRSEQPLGADPQGARLGRAAHPAVQGGAVDVPGGEAGREEAVHVGLVEVHGVLAVVVDEIEQLGAHVQTEIECVDQYAVEAPARGPVGEGWGTTVVL